jgi:hypothetical protein
MVFVETLSEEPEGFYRSHLDWGRGILSFAGESQFFSERRRA